MVWNYVIAVAITAVISYLLGCCNTSIVISKYFLRDDVRNHGSGNAGLTNFYRVFGQKKILFVILADVMKTVVSVLLGAAVLDTFCGQPVIGKLLGVLYCGAHVSRYVWPQGRKGRAGRRYIGPVYGVEGGADCLGSVYFVPAADKVCLPGFPQCCHRFSLCGRRLLPELDLHRSGGNRRWADCLET